MKSIHLITQQELADDIKSITPARYRVDQIWDGVYKHYYLNWNDFTTLPAKLIDYLDNNYFCSSVKEVNSISSADSDTTKYVLQLPDNMLIETVLIKTADRNTICISTQVGCAVGCSFCATGAAGFHRNLTADEIVDQVVFVANKLSDIDQTITNIVLMGMGEPFLNYDSTLKAVSIFNDQERFDIGARRITISTIGIPDKIREFADVGKQYNLAISLHAPNDKTRKTLVPLAQNISLDEIFSAAEYYVSKTNRRITYEYVLIKGINDGINHAQELGHRVKSQNCHINLIALNKNTHFKGGPPTEKRIREFIQILLDMGIPTTLRNSQGAEIQAGCGQLAGKYQN